MTDNTSEHLTLRSLRYEMRQIKTLLGCVADPTMNQHDHVFVSGSAPLLWWMISRSELSVCRLCMFRPNDIDMFVYGPPAESEDTYVAFVDLLLDNVVGLGYTIVERSEHLNWYILDGEPVLIIDVKIKGIHQTISFVQSPIDTSPQEVVNRFDINIV